MNDITLKEIGARLKEIRCYLGLSQTELAEELDCRQITISRLENGIGGGVKIMIKILSYYSKFVYINFLFEKDFILINAENKNTQKDGLNSIGKTVIDSALEEYEKEVSSAREKLKKNINTACSIMSG